MASVVSQSVPLDFLASGECGIVAEVDGSSAFIARLQEMGVNIGARVCIVQPGSPCIVEVNDQRFSIRMDDSSMVLVDVGR